MHPTLASFFGPAVSEIGFAIHLDDHRLESKDFALSGEADPQGSLILSGAAQGVAIRWHFRPERGGMRVQLSISSEQPLACQRLDSLTLTYHPGGCVDEWRIPTLGDSVESVGLPRVAQLAETVGTNPIQGKAGEAKYARGSLLRGAFADGHTIGLFLGTLLPQNFRHLYTVERVGRDALCFTATTHFLALKSEEKSETSGARQWVSETTWCCTSLPIRAAIAAYAGHLPILESGTPAIGWNSWDYYFSALRQDDILENMDAILANPVLAAGLKYIVVDMGWEHCWGEWQANYRFPDGLEHLAAAIRARGFIPGIWTAPLIIHPLSYPGLRNGEMLIQNQWGDPWPSPEGGQYAVDPTHPAGQAFLREVFTRLYQAGFRFFKIDFVSALLSAPRFHDTSKGPYGALADFFRLVRECVGYESHILGCSLPAECGPGLADSHRIGIDIHNQWSHIEWVVDFLQLAYWQNQRIAVNDPDFLVVRGQETSLEAETNVLNPMAHHPNPPRWRRGPVFNREEARTWATLVNLSGGNVFLSDRLAMLNLTGTALVERVLQPTGVAAVPLDLGENDRPALWHMALPGENRLGVINWSDAPVTKTICFADWQMPAPEQMIDFWTGQVIPIADGLLHLALAPHACRYFRW